jgi:hypothetical protein
MGVRGKRFPRETSKKSRCLSSVTSRHGGGEGRKALSRKTQQGSSQGLKRWLSLGCRGVSVKEAFCGGGDPGLDR